MLQLMYFSRTMMASEGDSWTLRLGSQHGVWCVPLQGWGWVGVLYIHSIHSLRGTGIWGPPCWRGLPDSDNPLCADLHNHRARVGKSPLSPSIWGKGALGWGKQNLPCSKAPQSVEGMWRGDLTCLIRVWYGFWEQFFFLHSVFSGETHWQLMSHQLLRTCCSTSRPAP